MGQDRILIELRGCGNGFPKGIHILLIAENGLIQGERTSDNGARSDAFSANIDGVVGFVREFINFSCQGKLSIGDGRTVGDAYALKNAVQRILLLRL